VALAAAGDGWGASWSFGPVHPTTSNHIIYTKTTLVPGRLPPWSSPTGPLFLWPGLSNPTSDLVQTTADAWGDNASACGAKAGQWCLEASVFGSFGQRSGPSVAVDPDDHITIEYKLGSDNNTWTQTVTSMKLGKVVSTLTSTSGLMLGGGFGFATEADANSYTIDTQYYLCTEIHLAAADPQFGATGSGAAGAMDGATGMGSGRGTIKNLHTPDSGLTWLADLITLPAMTPQGTQTPVPTYDCTSSGTGGIGGSTGSGGATGTAGAGGKGGSGGAGGRGTGGAASGGTNGSGGSGSGRGGAGGAASGGTTGSGGSGTGGHTGGTSGTGGAASGGSNGSGGSGSGSGGSGSGGQVTATGGKGGSGTGGDGTGGSANGSGGNGTGGAGEGGSGSGGAAGTSGEANGSGCSCDVPRNWRASTGGPLLLLGFLVLGLSRRRRNA
jgi:MYXO-CTERM domain-containing protein